MKVTRRVSLCATLAMLLPSCAPSAPVPVTISCQMLAGHASAPLMRLEIHNTSSRTTRVISFDAYNLAEPLGTSGFEVAARVGPGKSRTRILAVNDPISLPTGAKAFCFVNDVTFADGSLWTPRPRLMPL